MVSGKTPNPIFNFQGSDIGIQVNTGISIGKFTYNPNLTIGLDYSEKRNAKGIREICLHPIQIYTDKDEPCTIQLLSEYQQNGVEWEMVFRLTSDESGGMNGTEVALEVIEESSSDINMSIPKFMFNESGEGELKHETLPDNYSGKLAFKFWSNDLNIPKDAWTMLEIGYIVRSTSSPDPSIVPIVNLKLYPATIINN